MTKHFVIAFFVSMAVLAVGVLFTPRANAASVASTSHTSSLNGAVGYVSGQFWYDGYTVAGYYAGLTHGYNGGTYGRFAYDQGPGSSTWQDTGGHTNVTLWYNVRFNTTAGGFFCLYPRAIGYYNGNTSGYDGSNLSGNCSF